MSAVPVAEYYAAERNAGSNRALQERDGRVAVFYTLVDSGTPPIAMTEEPSPG
jgi:hypothetical protein